MVVGGVVKLTKFTCHSIVNQRKLREKGLHDIPTVLTPTQLSHPFNRILEYVHVCAFITRAIDRGIIVWCLILQTFIQLNISHLGGVKYKLCIT